MAASAHRVHFRDELARLESQALATKKKTSAEEMTEIRQLLEKIEGGEQ